MNSALRILFMWQRDNIVRSHARKILFNLERQIELEEAELSTILDALEEGYDNNLQYHFDALSSHLNFLREHRENAWFVRNIYDLLELIHVVNNQVQKSLNESDEERRFLVAGYQRGILVNYTKKKQGFLSYLNYKLTQIEQEKREAKKRNKKN